MVVSFISEGIANADCTRHAHRQRPHVPVVNRSALGIDLNRAPLLAHGPRHIFGMTDQLQVGQPAENCGHTKGTPRQPGSAIGRGFFLLHGSWDSARAPDGWKIISKLAGFCARPQRGRLGSAVRPHQSRGLDLGSIEI